MQAKSPFFYLCNLFVICIIMFYRQSSVLGCFQCENNVYFFLKKKTCLNLWKKTKIFSHKVFSDLSKKPKHFLLNINASAICQMMENRVLDTELYSALHQL